MKDKFEINMCEGSILKKLIIYALPLLATNVLQLLFNAADVGVLRLFLSKTESDIAVAAVGSNGALINLIVALFVGLSVGSNVLVARCMGTNDREKARRVVGTSMLVSVIVGFALMAIGYFGARTFLEWMQCDEDVIDLAAKYMRIYFLGMPVIIVYNFAASILRAVGDTVRPLVYLVLGGVINIGLNIFFVKVMNKPVEGVAIATVASQGISAVLSTVTLLRSDGFCKLDLRYLKIRKTELAEITKIGLPAGLQGCVFSISNVLIQSAINTYGDVVMTANTIASQFDGLIWNAMYAVALSALAFVSQNYGAGKMDRVKKTMWQSIAVTSVVGITLGGIVIAFAKPLCGLLSDTPEVVEYASLRLYIICSTYFLCGIMDVMSSLMRGLGKSTTAMIVSLSGSCLFRILWLNTFYLLAPSLAMVYIVYPISYVLTNAIYFALYFPTVKRAEKRLLEKKPQTENTTEK